VKPGDRELGMDRAITRRDFLNGAAAVTAGALLPGCFEGSSPESTAAFPTGPGDYPPLRSGARGSPPGSFDVAHELAFAGRSRWGTAVEPDPGAYDLVVVGGGISGLTAAYLWHRRDPAARILILDNHDDFGGHARRNEFQVGDRTVLGYGGSQTLESPQYYSAEARALLREIGVDVTRFDDAYDMGFYRRHGLRGGTFFDRAT